MTTEHIRYNDVLREGTDKLNKAIDQANKAEVDSEEALTTANQALQNSESTQTQLDTIVIEGDSSVEAAQARVNADGSITYTTLKERLDTEYTEVTKQSAQTEEQINSIENANAKTILKMLNYKDNYQNIHPKVLYFPNGWNGYKYWMAYTPYPNSSTEDENPCIAVSNDMINWEAPPGLSNPLDYPPSNGYNSDTHLVYNYDRDELEIWYRAYIRDSEETFIYRKRSNNGVDWMEKELMFHHTTREEDKLSPAIIYEDGKYKIWSVLRASRNIQYLESTDSTATSWTNEQIYNLREYITPWHLDVEKTDIGYEMLINARLPHESEDIRDLYHCVLKEDGTVTTPRLAIRRSSNPLAHDQRIYRSCLLKIDGMYYVFYSARTHDGYWSTSLSTGANIYGLNGMTSLERVDYEIVGDYIILNGDQVVEELDVSGKKAIIISGASNVTIKSLTGGQFGQVVTVALNHSQATVTFEDTGRIQLPNGKAWTMSYDKQSVVDLICTNPIADNNQFKVGVNQFNNKDRYVEINTESTLTDFDVTNVDTILISHPTTIKSFRGGHKGQRLSIITTATAEVTIENSTRIVTPDRNNYVFDNGGVTLVCTSDNGLSFRGFV